MTTFTVPALTFRQMLTGCLVGAGKNTDLPQINAVQMEVVRSEVYMASTDRYRLTVADAQAFRPGAVDGTILVNRSDADAIAKLLPARPEPEDAVTVKSLPDGMFGLSLGVPMAEPKWAVKFATVDAQFPKWRSLIPHTPIPVTSVKYTRSFLADLAKLPHDKLQPVEWVFYGDGKAAMAKWTSMGVNWTYLLMPVRL